MIDLKYSKTEQPDLFNHVQIDEKKIQECKNNERNAFIIKTSTATIIIIDYNNNSTQNAKIIKEKHFIIKGEVQ